MPVSRVAAGVGRHTAHDAFVGVAEQAGLHLTAHTGTQTIPGPGPKVESGAEPEVGAQPAAGAGAVAAAGGDTDPGNRRPCRSVSGPLPAVEVLGIDDHRRGKPLYHRDTASGAWVADADRWPSVFVDAAGGHGLLGQVEGRAKADVTGWLAAQDPAWRAGIRYVSIDLSSVYKSAATSGLLPHARLVADVFHVIQLANTMVGDVHRRVTYARYGRRGRAGDTEYAIKDLLRRGQEKLSKTARHKLLCALAHLGDGGRQIGAAWRAKELLRDLAKLSPKRTGLAAPRDKLSKALEAFFDFAITTASPSPRSRPSPRPSPPGAPRSSAACSPDTATPPPKAATASSNSSTAPRSASPTSPTSSAAPATPPPDPAAPNGYTQSQPEDHDQ